MSKSACVIRFDQFWFKRIGHIQKLLHVVLAAAWWQICQGLICKNTKSYLVVVGQTGQCQSQRRVQSMIEQGQFAQLRYHHSSSINENDQSLFLFCLISANDW